MNICFLTEGGTQIGLGHISRCQSLADAFKEKKHRCKFFIKSSNLSKKEIRFETEYINWIKEKESLLKSIHEFDIAIIDSYNAPKKLYEEIKKFVKFNIYFDDCKRIKYPPGFIINPALLAETIEYEMYDKIIYLLGPKYQPLQQPFWNIVPKIKNKELKKILITFGGDDLRNLTPKVLQMLNEEFSNLSKTIIIGENFTNVEPIKSLKYQNTKLVFNPGTNTICELMQKTDLAICGGGQTLYELARLKTPALIVGIAKNQENNIKSWQDYPFYKFAGWWNNEDIIGRLREKLFYFLINFDSIVNDIYYSNSIIDGQGSKRIVEKVLSHVRKN